MRGAGLTIRDPAAHRPRIDSKVAERARVRRGTKHGDETVGKCHGALCERVLHRGDDFVTPMAPKGVLWCLECWNGLVLRPLQHRRD